MNIVGNRNLRKLLEVMTKTYPEKTFLIFEDNDGNIEEFTYKQVDECVNKVANGLLDLGIKKGDKVNIHLSNCPEFIFFTASGRNFAKLRNVLKIH
ncbi:MAG: AMP-binding protein [Deltaproteobacteria bacterium]|nr:AMP-binding protein [Deltaproteobacteria bacterium]